jgi:hypothetical protein
MLQRHLMISIVYGGIVYGVLYLQLAALPLHTCVCSAANELTVDEDLRERVAERDKSR